MKKRTKGIAVGAIVMAATLCTSKAGYAGTGLSQEKPLAGITLSLDRYCENVVEDADTDAMQAQKEEELRQIEIGGVFGGAEALADATEGTASLTDTVSADTVEDSETKKTSEQKKPKISLNIKYDNLGIANVGNYLNVRKSAGEDGKVIGKMTKNTACDILKEKGSWAKIKSGSVTGWVKSEFLIKGKKAEDVAQKVATLKAVVKTQTLNVRYLPSTYSRIYDQLSEDEDYTIIKKNLSKEWIQEYMKKNISKKDKADIDKSEMYQDLKNWVLLSIDNEKVFASKDFINIQYKLNRAVSIKEEEENERKSQSSDSSSSSSGDSDTTSSTNHSSLVSYALQFLGNRYVFGGTSLTNGTDCSGFTMRIYQHFGYSLPRTSAAQAAATRSVSRNDLRVGDLFFYGNGSVSHVAMYIGNGQIIHASNARDGIKISNAFYRQPLKIGRVM